MDLNARYSLLRAVHKKSPLFNILFAVNEIDHFFNTYYSDIT